MAGKFDKVGDKVRDKVENFWFWKLGRLLKHSLSFRVRFASMTYGVYEIRAFSSGP